MAIRNIIKIDEEKCNGCGQCVTACAEGAIQIIDGKARLVSETYCDGLGACLGSCPQDAITIEQREAKPFDEDATMEYLAQKDEQASKLDLPCGCPGTLAQSLKPQPQPQHQDFSDDMPSQLANWPVQLKLVSPAAPYFKNADLLLVADCVPFALPDFHQRLLRGNPVVVGCPKLDDGHFYVDKLTEILKASEIKSLTIVHMEVPCCSGLQRIAEMALQQSGKSIPLRDVTISIQGKIIADEINQAYTSRISSTH